MTVAGAPGDRDGTQRVVTYYKGDLIRTETERAITIYDTKSQTITTLRPSDKTYQVHNLKEAVTSMPGLLTKMKVNATADIKPLPDRATIAGKRAQKFVGTATIQLASEKVPDKAFPTTKIEIEQWVTEDVDTGTVSQTLAPLKQFFGPLEPYGGMEQLIKEFEKMKGLPLSSRMTVTVAGTGNSRGSTPGPVVTTTEVQSVSDAPLSASLFTIPEGYQRSPLRTPKMPERRAP